MTREDEMIECYSAEAEQAAGAGCAGADGWVSAVERAANALEYRIDRLTSDLQPGNFVPDGIAAVLREGLTNDKVALATLKEMLRSPNNREDRQNG